jgi:hypothetical protein
MLCFVRAYCYNSTCLLVQKYLLTGTKVLEKYNLLLSCLCLLLNQAHVSQFAHQPLYFGLLLSDQRVSLLLLLRYKSTCLLVQKYLLNGT